MDQSLPLSFYSKHHLTKHCQVVHVDAKTKAMQRSFPCAECGKAFLKVQHMERHVKVVHEKIRQYRCRLCDIYFSIEPNLKEHIGVKHMGFKSGKQWREPANKETRMASIQHKAYQFIELKEAKARANT